MDCVDRQGKFAIAYAAILKWKNFSFYYSSVLFSESNNSEIKSISSFKKMTLPVVENNVLHWNNSSLKIDGTWTSSDIPVIENLIENDDDILLQWNCHQPRAICNLSIGENFKLKGLGYTETIKMQIEPWHLPIDELRWGRFVSEKHVVIWIDWKHANPLTIVYWNGNRVDARVTDDGIYCSEASLLFSDARIIKKDSIAKNIQSFPLLRSIFKSKILNTFECKMIATGTVKINGTEVCKEKFIYEIVKWN